MKTKLFVLAGIAGSILMLSTAAQAADIQAGQSKYQAVCASCHGAQAQGQAIFPALAGKDAGYLADLLERYRAGEEVGDNTALMRPQAQSLSDDDIANLSSYIATEFN
ncbi:MULTISPECIES: c-type cytochrome [unclassified Thioalkalivibrio]|uniref:c-type cytochrome n=1 Tax=unclassified Thioalkalivibrio TaxID=2621013 RepID=UPI00036B7FF7|nr:MULTISPECIES: c-type cytochrome [unclassified Thioalkalivibrio]